MLMLPKVIEQSVMLTCAVLFWLTKEWVMWFLTILSSNILVAALIWLMLYFG